MHYIGLSLVSLSLSIYISLSLPLPFVSPPVPKLSRGFGWPVRAKRCLWERSSQRTSWIPAGTLEPTIATSRDNLTVRHRSPPCPAPARRPRPDRSPWSGSAQGGYGPEAALGCGPFRGPGRQSPPDQCVGRPWPRLKTPVAVTKKRRLRPRGPVDRPRVAVVPPPQLRSG